MELLTRKLQQQLPLLYSQENNPDPLVICKFFIASSHWTWYAIEFDGFDLFYGYVAGDFPELGYFSLKELESVTGPLGLRVERDLYFQPQPLSEIKKRHE